MECQVDFEIIKRVFYPICSNIAHAQSIFKNNKDNINNK